MRASKFTDEARLAVVEAVAAGCSLGDAASAAGLALPTLKAWLARGRREDLGPYVDFERAVAEARDEAGDEARSAEAMSVAEFRSYVELGVRKGNVQAMRLWADRFLSLQEAPEAPRSAIAELAARRDGAS